MQGSRMYFHPPYAMGFTKPKAASSSEQSFIEEVRFLHSLWRQGPPSKRTRGENPPPLSEEDKKRVRLEPDKKKNKDKKKRQREAKTQKKKSRSQPTDFRIKTLDGSEKADDGNWNPASQWDTENPSSQPEWAAVAPKPEAKPLTEEEQLQFAHLRLQQKAARAFKEFLTNGRQDESSSSESDDNVAEDDKVSDDGDAPSGALAKEADALKFFDNLFGEDEELRRFYEQNCNCGVFDCLVCAAIGAKVGKKFPDCVSLIQHSMKILRTKKKAAHRGYGRAICGLLGWSSERLPSLPKTDSEMVPRGCIPPPDEAEAHGLEEEDNVEETNSDEGWLIWDEIIYRDYMMWYANAKLSWVTTFICFCSDCCENSDMETMNCLDRQLMESWNARRAMECRER